MQHSSGLSLLELMATVAVAAILATIAVPSYLTMIQNNRLTSQVNELIASLALARSEAIKGGTTVYVCSSDDQSNCVDDKWSDGWLVWSDEDGDGTLDTSDSVLKAFASEVDASVLSIAKNSTSKVMKFRTDGSTTTPASYLFCDERGAGHARMVTVSRVGRARVERADDGYSLPTGLSCS